MYCASSCFLSRHAGVIRILPRPSASAYGKDGSFTFFSIPYFTG
ncbi:hypothetical protein KNP414_05980 [Paenibacillus mucilaginosus KNP414]|uniref:Uncharacterized protein n=1 Tax=Paenibacillus mucilaginosus (strain KNP414) TaxID=1036673 RepID=F8FEA5_PAEMK|nr:hypothetical protein KNP414_05980 [Paenibacillus mucilaginosus KNP414]